MKTIAFFDTEVNPESGKILDIGGVDANNSFFHQNSTNGFEEFIKSYDFICGHNIFQHDLKHLEKFIQFNKWEGRIIDTLYLSPLLFPTNPYHHLVKDDKLITEELSNPVNDSKKSREVFYDELAAFERFDKDLKVILFNLLHSKNEFTGFFNYVDFNQLISQEELTLLIKTAFFNKICSSANIKNYVEAAPVELAYCLALIAVSNQYSITPPWVLHAYPRVNQLIADLRNTPCATGCSYCADRLDPVKALKRYFKHDAFRKFDGQSLQEDAVNAAIYGKSLLTIFPTGGGKSITFQVPALMSGENEKALTVIISPLQSLMKDQVDNLQAKHGITDAVTINGLLDPVERQHAIERINGTNKDVAIATILYISPESLRSVTIEKLLLGRKIARFVIDEAHCFSSWGQDFRVDYLYIGDFIRNLQIKKGLQHKIPISCFTATAKQKVIEDIKEYFHQKLDLQLEVFRAASSRTNLSYKVFKKETEEEKYNELRRLLEMKSCPTIIYVSRTKKARQLAENLSKDGFTASAFHGKMEKEEKIANQNGFIEGSIQIMVATSAFGMGVDKDDVGMVIHYDISDSLENYIQEAGRAGRKEGMAADCYVLFSEDDLDKHFLMLNQTKLNSKEINQVWKAIKQLSRTRNSIWNSALEIARKAGWDENIRDIETRVTTAIAALEQAEYLKRGQNMPKVFASAILTKTAQEAIDKIRNSDKFQEIEKEKAIRIIKKLFSSKSKRLSTEEPAESRVDYISDHLSISKEEVIKLIQILREEKILSDDKDLTAFIKRTDRTNRSLTILETYGQIENFLVSQIQEGESTIHLKELNEAALNLNLDASPQKIRSLINFWAVKNWIKKESHNYSNNHIAIQTQWQKGELKKKMGDRHVCARFILEYLFKRSQDTHEADQEEVLVEFSVLELLNEFCAQFLLFNLKVSADDMEDALLFLSRIEAISIEGGFLIIYNRLTIQKLETNSRIQYKEADYVKLKQFYEAKTSQIHIVGAYARKMIEDTAKAYQFVSDYFDLNENSFLDKYFGDEEKKALRRNISQGKFKRIFGDLSPAQMEIISDKKNNRIVVAAGPGSGKTRVLVHKLASILLTEDVKSEQLLMLTFSRAAATEFKKRLLDIIGNAAHYVEIRTFHSFCFDLLGKTGSITESKEVIQQAIQKIQKGDVEVSRITRTVLVLDEAQDMDKHDYELVRLLMEKNEEMKLILVGDDDQSIYGFRNADAAYMESFLNEGAQKYELIINYRSKPNLVDFTNQWVQKIQRRLKTEPIVADQKDVGSIKITRYRSSHLIEPLVKEIKESEYSGSTCILTRTNEEASLIAGLLAREGYNTRLVQSNDGFKLYQLNEFRYFTDKINGQNEHPVIDQESWDQARQQLAEAFASSNKLSWCMAVIEEFEKVNPKRKYKSDWKTFLMESAWEDFIKVRGETFYVSTMHKAKGKEYDNVILLLDGFNPVKDEEKRLLYVAITRAKYHLSIHYNGNYLDKILADNQSVYADNQTYQPPNFINLPLVHGNVFLNYFINVQTGLSDLQPGTALHLHENGLANASGLVVVRFSNQFKNYLAFSNYKLTAARVNYKLYWKGKDMEKEVMIVLPELEFERVNE
jgi:ATP-dependent DNA helicase RecQ